MKLTQDIELINGLPIAYIKSMNALIISDLHLGFEGIAAKAGIYAPKANLKKAMKMILDAINIKKADKVIVIGDIKNEFASIDAEEYKEMLEFIKFIKNNNAKLILIKGNHDNFVDRYKTIFDIEIYPQEMKYKQYLFFHGEEMPKNISNNTKMLIMGHEHPAISIISKIRKKEKLKCFLFGTYKKRKLLVLPAINYFMPGTDINIEPKSHLLSPILKKINIDKFNAIAIGYGSTIDFGSILNLRHIIVN